MGVVVPPPVREDEYDFRVSFDGTVGFLDETLVVWGGEFGRTAYCQGKLTETNYGRDHHPRCFSMWMAGGGIQGGQVYGSTDDFSYNIEDKPVHVRDLNATILHLLGLDHERLTYRYGGRDVRLTDVHGEVIRSVSDLVYINLKNNYGLR